MKDCTMQIIVGGKLVEASSHMLSSNQHIAQTNLIGDSLPFSTSCLVTKIISLHPLPALKYTHAHTKAKAFSCHASTVMPTQ